MAADAGNYLSFLPGSVTYAPFLQGSLAQSVEQLAFNQLVEGSNPSRPTTYAFLARKTGLQ